MDQSYATLNSAIIAGIVAIIASLITTRSQMKRFNTELKIQAEQECEKKRLQYLDPLRIAAQDLLDKMNKLSMEMLNNGAFYKDKFHQTKYKDRNQKGDFAFWCNGEGACAVTTLYITAVYFAQAKKIRSEIPFIQLKPHKDQSLLNFLYSVRECFGSGQHNLWVELQDSLGSYVTNPDGSIMNYKGFCIQLIDHWDHIWFTRLIDYYKDFHMKEKKEVTDIISSLSELISFIQQESSPVLIEQKYFFTPVNTRVNFWSRKIPGQKVLSGISK